jgi:hypothetical protein
MADPCRAQPAPTVGTYPVTKRWSSGGTRHAKRNPSQRAPELQESDPDPLQRAPLQRESPQRAPSVQRASDLILEQESGEDPPFVNVSMEEPLIPTLRRSTHVRKANPKYAQHGAVVVRSYCAAMLSALMLTSGHTYDNHYLLNLLLDHGFGLYDNLGADTLMCYPPHAMKASTTADPDPPCLHKAMSREYRE